MAAKLEGMSYYETLEELLLDAIDVHTDIDNDPYIRGLTDAMRREETREINDWTTAEWYAWYGNEDKAEGNTFPWNPGSVGYQGD